MKNIIAGLALSIMVIFPAQENRAGDIATESTQVVNGGITAILAYTEELIRIATDVMLVLEQWNSEKLADYAFDSIPGLQDIFSIMAQIEGLINRGQAIAHTSANLEQRMRTTFKTYQEHLDEITADGGIIRDKFEDRYREWSQTHNDTVRNILEASGLHNDEFATDGARLQTLQGRSTNAEGRMQAIQVGNEIAIEEVKQLGKLREMVLEQTSLHASYFAKKQAQVAQSEAATTWNIQNLRATVLDDGQGFQ